jgi:Xaa-Pro aminopeptidase
MTGTAAPEAIFGRVDYGPDERRHWAELAFPVEEYRERVARLQARLAEQDLAGAIVRGVGADVANVAYLSGWTNPLMGDAIVVVPTEGEPALVTNAIVHGEPMHTEIYKVWFDDVRCSPHGRGDFAYENAPIITEQLIECLSERHMTKGRCALVGRSGDEIWETVTAACPDLSTEPFDIALAGMRAIKSPAEQLMMRRAAEIADEVLLSAIDAIGPGVSEHEVAAELARTMLAAGADGPLYFIQVVSGPRSGFRNVRPSERRMEVGDPVYVGFGLRYRGYCARAGAGACVGEPSAEWRSLLDANVRILEESLTLARPGAPVRDAALAGTRLAAELGLAGETWVGGHGIGAHTHDLPFIVASSDDRFEPGMTFIFEPMICRTGLGTANAERVFLMTIDGAQPLSRAPFRIWER